MDPDNDNWLTPELVEDVHEVYRLLRSLRDRGLSIYWPALGPFPWQHPKKSDPRTCSKQERLSTVIRWLNQDEKNQVEFAADLGLSDRQFRRWIREFRDEGVI